MQKVAKIAMKFAFHSKGFSFILQNPDDFSSVKNTGYVPDKNLYLIKGSGVDLDEFNFTPQPNNSVQEILFPARMLRDKGIMELVETAGLLRDKLKGKAKFVLAGDCNSTNPTALKEKDLLPLLEAGYIEWIGYQKEMKPVYQKSDIVVLPSYREGLPKSLIEACAIGRPIVTTNVTGCRECVNDMYNGFLVPAKQSVPLAEAIEKLVDNQSLRKTMGENSRKIAERDFSIDNVVKKHFEIYQSLIKL